MHQYFKTDLGEKYFIHILSLNSQVHTEQNGIVV